MAARPPSSCRCGCPHAALVPTYWDLAGPVRLPLPIIPCVNASDHRFGGFGVSRQRSRCYQCAAWRVSTCTPLLVDRWQCGARHLCSVQDPPRPAVARLHGGYRADCGCARRCPVTVGSPSNFDRFLNFGLGNSYDGSRVGGAARDRPIRLPMAYWRPRWTIVGRDGRRNSPGSHIRLPLHFAESRGSVSARRQILPPDPGDGSSDRRDRLAARRCHPRSAHSRPICSVGNELNRNNAHHINISRSPFSDAPDALRTLCAILAVAALTEQKGV